MKSLLEMENSGLVVLLRDEKFEDLSRMYVLFRREHVKDGLKTIRELTGCYIKETGKQIVMDPERQKEPVDFVQTLLELKDKFDGIIRKSFGSDKHFQNTLNQSFENFINLNVRSPEYISLFMDEKLRKGLKGINEDDTEVVLDKVMMLFRYLQEKD
jgi:cullin 3